jgi:hypothetical protein
MKSFTKFQKEEIIGLIEIRQDTIDEDPDSESGIELIPDGLKSLQTKIETGNMDFTSGEKQWLLEECEMRADVALANIGSDGIKVLGLLNSMNNAMTKIMDV